MDITVVERCFAALQALRLHWEWKCWTRAKELVGDYYGFLSVVGGWYLCSCTWRAWSAERVYEIYSVLLSEIIRCSNDGYFVQSGLLTLFASIIEGDISHFPFSITHFRVILSQG
jgi:hypothetical protein